MIKSAGVCHGTEAERKVQKGTEMFSEIPKAVVPRPCQIGRAALGAAQEQGRGLRGGGTEGSCPGSVK